MPAVRLGTSTRDYVASVRRANCNLSTDAESPCSPICNRQSRIWNALKGVSNGPSLGRTWDSGRNWGEDPGRDVRDNGACNLGDDEGSNGQGYVPGYVRDCGASNEDGDSGRNG